MPITDAGVDTVAFLEADEGLVRLFGQETIQSGPYFIIHKSLVDLLGSTAFSVVQADLKGNIAVRRISLLNW